ncbi:MAG: SulP family inorganic anion transporter [Cyclobacteriaceae bacterium]|jgi:MFS superfamily sulfate permease-like transporter
MSIFNQEKNPFSHIKSDLPSSIIVFFVALPLCLGIALASGAPLFSGIIAGVVGGIVVGMISNSALGVSGPAAGLTVIVLSSIEKLGAFEAFLLAVVLAGLLQIILGVLKAGVIGYYFPSSVIKGMLSAIGVIIILKQIPHAFGYDNDYEGDLTFFQADGENTFSEIVVMIDSISPGAILLSMLSLAILIFWDNYLGKRHQFFKLIQGPLVVVVFGILYQIAAVNYFPRLALEQQHLVNVPMAENITQFMGQFTLPNFNYIFQYDIWIIAFTIAVVASLESLLSVEATDNLDKQKRVTNTNRELIAQGTGNLVSGLIGGLPVTQVIIRSSVNIQSGGKTKLSAILHGIFLLICVGTIPGILNMIPLAVLAAILLVVGFKLVKPDSIMQMYKLGWGQFLPFIVTIIGVVMTDLLTGIVLGFSVSLVIILRRSFKNSHFLHVESSSGKNQVKMTLAEEVYFLNKGAILNELNNVKNGCHVTIDISRSVNIDHDVLEVINNFRSTAASRDIEVTFIESKTDGDKASSSNHLKPHVLENVN